jgi:tRNA (adenine22-N1)-methyltransferase
MELSKRLQAVADCVTEGLTIADIGTDHGYIPIYLVESGISPGGLAMDINQGPLKRAQEHIRTYGLEEKITTRLSDGIDALLPMEAECVIIAGMGGGLMIHILEQDPENIRGIREWIFEPQSDVEAFRRYLYEHSFRILEENFIEEDGKYYPVIKAVSGIPEACTDVEYRYGKLLLEKQNPVLQQYLVREWEIKDRILSSLAQRDGDRIRERREELKQDLDLIETALRRFDRDALQ